ncbi:dihydroorotate oxidase A [Luteococcus japonicus]|uniref:Dihydroorotate dehydrogenase (quinone) n=1 Tax=Luteococcus japonicus TaxID=33984 RepID=A0A3N1ZTN9_9ACTN|nr:quinone-dependent dihydroorotate dehydrogenase [Luteococcus japonicus]ROR53522.1 dihydroorotate oxidase A [Luteococcus japonicus]
MDEMLTRALLHGYRQVVRPGLFRARGGDAEKIHEDMIRALGIAGGLPGGVLGAGSSVMGTGKGVELAGISFPGRVGVAAGLDKNGLAARAWAGLGFGFAELGTVTAQAQPGNPKPRVFRAKQSDAVINRMGFNNEGAAALASRLDGWGVRRGNAALGIPLGISLGKTKVTPLEGAVEDYLRSLRLLADKADYIAINISSPNTPGLRSLQDGDALRELTRALVAEAKVLNPSNPVPIFVKVAPDLTWDALYEVIGTCELAGVAGLIATNTTLDRKGLKGDDVRLADEAGGLSGAPLTVRSRAMVARIVQHSSLPVMGVGGIMTPADAQAMFDAGASLVQVYTGFIYNGPALVRGINALPHN